MHISDDEEGSGEDIAKIVKTEGGGLTGYGSDDGTYGGYTNLGIANVDNWLNVRKEPKEEGEIIGKMPKHAGCEVLDVTDDGYWAHVKSGKVEGYASTEYLLMGLRSVKDGAVWFDPNIAHLVKNNSNKTGSRSAFKANHANLTEREYEVLKLIVDGKSNQDIANELKISEKMHEFRYNKINLWRYSSL